MVLWSAPNMNNKIEHSSAGATKHKEIFHIQITYWIFEAVKCSHGTASTVALPTSVKHLCIFPEGLYLNWKKDTRSRTNAIVSIGCEAVTEGGNWESAKWSEIKKTHSHVTITYAICTRKAMQIVSCCCMNEAGLFLFSSQSHLKNLLKKIIKIVVMVPFLYSILCLLLQLLSATA